ncbi:MAG: hypothetical protein ACFFDN_43050 [Candidatus Hodarchaeota archaeon]
MGNGIFLDIEDEDRELILNLQDEIPLEMLYEKWGGKSRFYYQRNRIFEKYDIHTTWNVPYERLGLIRYFILSKYRFKSPYLVQKTPYYIPHLHYLSQFVISADFEKEFSDKIIKLDPKVTIYQADELAPPSYSFNNLDLKIAHEMRFFRWMALVQGYKVPELKITKRTFFEFDLKYLEILHHLFKDDTKQQAIKATELKEWEYEDILSQLKESFLQRALSINAISKLLYIIDRPPENISGLTLINSFIELFVFCHPFKVKKIYPFPRDRWEYGYLCIIMPPTNSIPFFHHQNRIMKH